jgi:hypothetical protein
MGSNDGSNGSNGSNGVEWVEWVEWGRRDMASFESLTERSRQTSPGDPNICTNQRSILRPALIGALEPAAVLRDFIKR